MMKEVPTIYTNTETSTKEEFMKITYSLPRKKANGPEEPPMEVKTESDRCQDYIIHIIQNSGRPKKKMKH